MSKKSVTVNIKDDQGTGQEKPKQLGPRVGDQQKRILVDFITEHPLLARPISLEGIKDDHAIKKNELWETVVAKLNSVGPAYKSIIHWKKYFSNWASDCRQSSSALRDKIRIRRPLTVLEKRIAELFDHSEEERCELPELDDTQSPSHSVQEFEVVTNQDDGDSSLPDPSEFEVVTNQDGEDSSSPNPTDFEILTNQYDEDSSSPVLIDARVTRQDKPKQLGPRVGDQQKSILVDFITEHPLLARPIPLEGIYDDFASKKYELWEILVDKLNSVGPAIKTTNHWKRYFSNWASDCRQSSSALCDKIRIRRPLTVLEKRIAELFNNLEEERCELPQLEDSQSLPHLAQEIEVGTNQEDNVSLPDAAMSTSKRNVGPRVDDNQKELLVNFIQKHPELARKSFAVEGNLDPSIRGQLWITCTTMLNSAGFAQKSSKGWKKFWSNWVGVLRSFKLEYNMETQKSEIKRRRNKPLTPLEEKVLGLAGEPELRDTREQIADPGISIQDTSVTDKDDSMIEPATIIKISDSTTHDIMKRNCGPRVGDRQKAILVNFIMKQPYLALGPTLVDDLNSATKKYHCWKILTAKLNSVGPANKTLKEWKKYWSNWVSDCKIWRKEDTADRKRRRREFTPLERKIFSLIDNRPHEHGRVFTVFPQSLLAHNPEMNSSSLKKTVGDMNKDRFLSINERSSQPVAQKSDPPMQHVDDHRVVTKTVLPAHVKDTGHRNNFITNLNEQRKDGEFCDILLKVLGQSLPTHACVLSASSSVFRQLILESEPPSEVGVPQEIEVALPGEDDRPATQGGTGRGLEAMLDLIDYIYTGDIILKSETIDLVVKLAEAFMLDELVNIIRAHVNFEIEKNIGGNSGVLPTISQAESVSRLPERNIPSEIAPTNTSRRKVLPILPKSLPVTQAAITDMSNMRLVLIRLNPDQLPAVTETSVTPNVVLAPEPLLVLGQPLASVAVASNNVEPAEKQESNDDFMRQEKEEAVNNDFVEWDEDEEMINDVIIEQTEKEQEVVTDNNDSIKKLKPSSFCLGFNCLSCNFATARVLQMLDHLREANHDETECCLCGWEAGDKENFLKHLTKHEDKKNPYFCHICSRQMDSRAKLTEHMSKHSTERPHVCDICGKCYSWSTSLTVHKLSHGKKMHLCDVCGYETAYISNLRSHERSHRQLINCDRCTYQTHCKHALAKHQRRHASPKIQLFVCDTCGVKFMSKNGLRTHMKTFHHTGENRLRCTICTFSTYRIDRMRGHAKKNHDGLGFDK